RRTEPVARAFAVRAELLPEVLGVLEAEPAHRLAQARELGDLFVPDARNVQRFDRLEPDHAICASVQQTRQVRHAASQGRFTDAPRSVGRLAVHAELAGLPARRPAPTLRVGARLEQHIAVLRPEGALGVALVLALLPLV